MNANRLIYGSVIMAFSLSSRLVPAQPAPADHGTASTQAWRSDSVVFVAGLDDLKQNAVGSLAMAGDNLVFSAKDAHKQIPLREITSVSIGEERVATGGTSAKQTLKNSKHSDSDSLGVARDVARNVSKRLGKTKSPGFEAAV